MSVRSRSLSVAAGTPLQVARPVVQGTRIEGAEAVQELLVDEGPIVNRIGAGCNPGGRIPRSCLLHSNARGGGGATWGSTLNVNLGSKAGSS